MSSFWTNFVDCQKPTVWSYDEPLASGAFGTVYTACRRDDCEYILKIQPNNEEFGNELNILRELKSWTHAPTLHADWICNGKGYLVIDKLVPCPKVSWKAISSTVQELHQRGVSHNDMHPGNVMCDSSGRIKLIDYGLSVLREDVTPKEWLHLVADDISAVADLYASDQKVREEKTRLAKEAERAFIYDDDGDFSTLSKEEERALEEELSLLMG
jgi:serine/threonine protein kinase